MKYRDDSKIDALIAATIDLVFEQGLVGITISKVAKRAKVATGTVYIYFSSKEVLLIHTFTSLKKRVIDNVTDDIDFSQPFLPTMKKLWLNYFNHMLKNQKEEVFIEQFKYSPFASKVKVGELEEVERPIAEFLEVGKQELLIKNEDNSLIYGALVGITREMAKTIYQGQMKFDTIVADKMFKIVWDSIKN